MSTPNNTGRKRDKYSHPCDACSIRKVKCDSSNPCEKCSAHNIPCTRNRVRKKSGRKELTKKTRDGIENASQLTAPVSDDMLFTPAVTIDQLLPSLQIYQTWFYGVWPVVSVAHLTSKLVHGTTGSNFSSEIHITKYNISTYALSCAVAAAIIKQVASVKSNPNLIYMSHKVDGELLARECLKARDVAKSSLDLNIDSMLTAFFLYIYYANTEKGIQWATIHLREAISIAQVLGLHDNNSYITRSTAEVHRLRKIYYLLLVTERFVCIEDNLPVILDACIPYPSLQEEEYSTLLSGFTELVKVFSIPDKTFFDKLVSLKTKGIDPFDQSTQPQAQHYTQSWIVGVQQQLAGISVAQEMPEIQKVNILLSKYWMQALSWNISKDNKLLLDSVSKDTTNEPLLKSYPIKIAQSLLKDLRGFQIFSFELNGSGACVKLLEIANSLIESIIYGCDQTLVQEGVNHLNEIFTMATTLQSDPTISPDLYHRVQSFIANKSSQQLQRMGYLSEISEEDSSETSSSTAAASFKGAEQTKEFVNSPFTEIAMAFCTGREPMIPHFQPSETLSHQSNLLYEVSTWDSEGIKEKSLSFSSLKDLASEELY